MEDKQQKIIAELRRIAELLNRGTVTRNEFRQFSEIGIATSTVEPSFGSWNKAIEAASLTPVAPTHLHGQYTTSDEALLEEIRRLTSQFGRPPSANEMEAFGRHSPMTYRKRWGTFGNAVKMASTTGEIPPSIENVSPNLPPQPIPFAIPNNVASHSHSSSRNRLARKKIQYGEPIDFRGLRHAPVNEQGVVYMFGMVSHELGFLIESLRTADPDCEGKRLVDETRQLWENVLIEFEFRSRNFVDHGHNPDECDVIVCWINDWPDSPSNLEIIELRSRIAELPSN